MTPDKRPWSERFRPKTMSEVVDNEAALRKLLAWVRSWGVGIPDRRSVILYGPPGTGKNSMVEAVANDLGFDLIEVNASDQRTASRIDEALGKNTVQTQTLFGKRRMILFDELEGISGQEDRGGVEAILRLIKETRNPIVMIATGSAESWEELLNPLIRVSELIEVRHAPMANVLQLLKRICDSLEIEAQEEALELVAERSNGDLRSAVNDLEAAARGKKTVSLDDVYWLGNRDRKNGLTEVLHKIFSAKSFREAREAQEASPVKYEELFEWVYENIPYFYEDSHDLSRAMEALARADMYKKRADDTQEYRLLKYFFDAMTAEVALARQKSKGTGLIDGIRKASNCIHLAPSSLFIQEEREGIIVKPTKYLGNDWQPLNNVMRELGGRWQRERSLWIIPYFRPPGRISHLAGSWWSRRRNKDLQEKVAKRCHISKRSALIEVIPYIKAIFRENPRRAMAIGHSLDLEEDTIKWLKEK